MLKRIYYHDTDCGGVVYYANYLKYLEEARTEYMESRGYNLSDLAEKGILFVVRRVDIEYKAPAHYADTLEISTSIDKIRNVSVNFLQEIKREGKILVSAVTTLVCIDKNFKPCAMCEEMINGLSK
ncbi:MAG: YbgC/FadM family acyl-CoA thioesterase [Candidatus Omnitrophica bacterium]|nr:YbgC/FadM family acyl-CoA thioesterase [Candidatus Omnitrophota bacterium]